MLEIISDTKISQKAIKQVVHSPYAVGGHDQAVTILEGDQQSDPTIKCALQLPANINSMAVHGGKMAIGLQDGQVGLRQADGSLCTIYRHMQNVCSLAFDHGCVLSGSWDNSAILYKNDICHPFPHPASVWTTSILSENSFVTGCADSHLRIFGSSESSNQPISLLSDFSLHTAPIRGLVCLSNSIVAVDNLGKLLKISMAGEILQSRNLSSFCYCICRFQDYFAIGGEDGWVYIVDQQLELQDRIHIPEAQSIWDVCEVEGTLNAVGDNGVLYRLRLHHEAGPQACAAEESTGTSPSSSVSGQYRSGEDSLKVENGNVYIRKGSEWELMGTVSSDDLEAGSETKTFDNSFDVTLNDKQYTLSFNDSDNIESVASSFLRENGLESHYFQEIVDFIKKNFRQASHFKKYDKLNTSGIKKLLRGMAGDASTRMVELLEEDTQSSTKVFREWRMCGGEGPTLYALEEWLRTVPTFIRLDIYKYLVFRGYHVDLSFLHRLKIGNSKEAKALCFLATNMVENPPFNMEKIYGHLGKLKDKGLLSDRDMGYLNENMALTK